ncbi:MAG: hypothetical protein LQ352_003246 [Teloschistes flavicans]|nr:MAG: hypothetical protein LQ352_003246 [Teloschistes flavicans]
MSLCAMEILTWQTNTIWPPCPYKVIIPKRLGTPFILVTKNDRRDHGYRAKLLAIAVCHQMSDWIQKLPQSSEIKEVHWEHNSQGDEYAVEHSIYLSLDPIYPHGNLERELAYFAIEELRSLVFTYGAMEGVFEIWSRKTKRAVGTFHIFKWPEMNNTLGSSHTIQK